MPRVEDPRGNLTALEGGREIPFAIQRVYYLYDVPGGATRGAHAHRRLEQVLISVHGSFDVVVHDGRHEETFTLNRAYRGLYIPPMIWRDIINFSSGSVCLVLASAYYDEADYIRDHNAFLRTVR